MNIPLLIVLLYVVLLFVISFRVSQKQKKDGDAFLLYKRIFCGPFRWMV